jgi:hypothetical protein
MKFITRWFAQRRAYKELEKARDVYNLYRALRHREDYDPECADTLHREVVRLGRIYNGFIL